MGRHDDKVLQDDEMEIRGSLQSEFVETPSAKEAVLFSNTASFLLDRLRKDSSAAYVAHKLKTDEIVELVKDRIKAPPASPLDLLWLYVLLAALSLKDDLQQFKDRINSNDLSQFQWGDEIRKYILEDKTTTNFLDTRYTEIRKNSQTGTANRVTTGRVLVPGGSR
jgi:hypothetical protein